MPLDAVILNRVHTSCLQNESQRTVLGDRIRSSGPRSLLQTCEEQARAAGEPHRLLGVLLRSIVDHELLAAGDRSRIDSLAEETARDLLMAEVPRFSRDVYDLVGLKTIVDALFPEEGA